MKGCFGNFSSLVVAVCCLLNLHYASGQIGMCVDCTSERDGVKNDFCPPDKVADLGRVPPLACNGTCFYMGQRDGENAYITRGCSATVGNLPQPLPKEGCYDWKGATICICNRPVCNAFPLGKSSGVALDAHLAELDPADLYPDDKPGVLYCHQCSNYDADDNFFPQCPRNARVNPRMIYTGNCTGACFTRTRNGNTRDVYRGCTSTQYGLPYPLPKDGCYTWNSDVWCICTSSRCNGQPMGKSSGVEMDEHLINSDEPIVEEDGVKKCFQCTNYDLQGNYYPQCPKTSRVRNAYLGPCNGTCFTRSYDYNSSLVARGCTDTQYGLPDPLPPDGCYKWYSEVWCVCSTSRCNGKAIGAPQNIEFDAHIKHGGGGAGQMACEMMVALGAAFFAGFLNFLHGY